MGFNDVKKGAVELIEHGRFLFDLETAFDGRNHLATGEVTVEFVVGMLNRCRGDQYSSNPHHFHQEITVHIFKPNVQKTQWYIKFHFDTDQEGQLVLIMSVHPTRHR